MKARPNYKLSVLDRNPHLILYIEKARPNTLLFYYLPYIRRPTELLCFIIYSIYRGERKLLYILSSFVIYRCFIELMKVE